LAHGALPLLLPSVYWVSSLFRLCLSVICYCSTHFLCINCTTHCVPGSVMTQQQQSHKHTLSSLIRCFQVARGKLSLLNSAFIPPSMVIIASHRCSGPCAGSCCSSFTTDFHSASTDCDMLNRIDPKFKSNWLTKLNPYSAYCAHPPRLTNRSRAMGHKVTKASHSA